MTAWFIAYQEVVPVDYLKKGFTRIVKNEITSIFPPIWLARENKNDRQVAILFWAEMPATYCTKLIEGEDDPKRVIKPLPSILDVPCTCSNCDWSGTVYDCIPDIDGDGSLGCPECEIIIEVRT